MQAHVSSILLGVQDMDRSKRMPAWPWARVIRTPATFGDALDAVPLSSNVCSRKTAVEMLN